MMKKNIVILLLVAMIVSSCKKSFLSPSQVDLVYNEVYWKTSQRCGKGTDRHLFFIQGFNRNAQMYNRGDITTGLINRGWNGGSDPNFYLPGDYSNINGTRNHGAPLNPMLTGVALQSHCPGKPGYYPYTKHG